METQEKENEKQDEQFKYVVYIGCMGPGHGVHVYSELDGRHPKTLEDFTEEDLQAAMTLTYTAQGMFIEEYLRRHPDVKLKADKVRMRAQAAEEDGAKEAN